MTAQSGSGETDQLSLGIPLRARAGLVPRLRYHRVSGVYVVLSVVYSICAHSNQKHDWVLKLGQRLLARFLLVLK